MVVARSVYEQLFYNSISKHVDGDKFTKMCVRSHTKNYKMLLREIKGDLNEWREVLCSLIGRLNTNMSVTVHFYIDSVQY